MKKRTLVFLIIGFLLIAAGLFACNLPKIDASVTILNPVSGQSIPALLEYQVTSSIKPEGNWSRVELYINGELIRLDTPETNPGTFGLVIQPWIPTTEGPTMIEVKLYQRGKNPIATGKIAVMVKAMGGEEIPPTPTMISPTPEVTPIGTTTPAPCTMSAALLQDLNIPDGTTLIAGQRFTKTWRVQNNGTCDWENYKLVFVRGSLMGGNSPTLVPKVLAGGMLDISLELFAPSFQGDYTGYWQIQAESGALIGPELYYRIRNGEINEMVEDAAYQIRTPEFWNACSAICDARDFRLGGSFFDGKGQPSQVSAVSHGSATTRFNGINIINTARSLG